MSRVIIINGPSCAGKTTIAKEICKQSSDQFVHLQIDKAGEFYGTIFPKGFMFAENEIGTEKDDDGLKGLFNNNRLARRKVVASILLGTALSLLKQGFDILIDTSLDGPDAKDLARLYLESLRNYNTIFVGIYCPVEERLKRLKTRKDNLFLTEDFIKNQTYQYDVFESCKEFYDIWFDSSLLCGEEIAKSILQHNKNAHQNTIPKFAIRAPKFADIPAMVSLSKAKRLAYEKAQPQFWKYAGEEGDKAQEKWFTELLENKNYVMFTAESEVNEILGFIIGRIMPAPEVYDPGVLTMMIDDFCVKSESLWQTVGLELTEAAKVSAKAKGVRQILVVCGAHDNPKRKFLSEQNLSIASEWFLGEV